jgi:hypothetical protein
MQDAARLYRMVEARLEEKKAQYDEACKKDKRALEQLELIMLQMLKQAGVRGMNITRTDLPPHGADVKIVDKRVFGCGDWDTFYTFVVTQNKPELLQKRIHEANMQAFIDEHGGDFIPPGVNVHTEAVIKVLKGK